jgi:serine/threonine-protein kinase TTK/MPS1
VWVIDRRYDKIGKIGKGGSSEVFKVIASDCSIYALKRISLKGRDFTSARGFCQEIEYLQRLKGKRHIIQLIDFEVSSTCCFYILMNTISSFKDVCK